MLSPKTARTFYEYFGAIFAPYATKQPESVGRVDLVWDVYVTDSLKRSAQEREALANNEKKLLSTQIPSEWKEFLRVDLNKDELFKLLANKVKTMMI